MKLRLKKNHFPFSVEICRTTIINDSIIGNNAYIGPKCIINSADIGSYTCIAPGVQIGGMEHSYWWYTINPQLSNQCISRKRTKIGHDVWIAANAIIKQGITIGDGAVVGVGSFVNMDVPPFSVVVGIPSKVIKMRFDDELILRLNNSRYWVESPKKAKDILIKLDESK